MGRGGGSPVPDREGSAGAFAPPGRWEGGEDTARCPSAPLCSALLRRPAPGAQVSHGVGCQRCHGGGCEGHPGGRAGGRELRGAGRLSGGLGSPSDTAQGESGVPPRRRFASIAGGSRALGGAGAAQVCAGLRARPQRVPGTALEPSPVFSLECAARDLLAGCSGAREKRLASHLLSPAGLPPGQRQVGCGMQEGFAPPEPQALPISRAVLWCERGCLTLPPPQLLGS